jgi:hypothetical protein
MTLSVALMLAAVGAFVVANLIHNAWGLDAAVVPGLVFAGLTLWRRRRLFLGVAAVVVVASVLAFLNWSALAAPSDTRPFFNHLFLLAAGVLATASAALGLRRTRH